MKPRLTIQDMRDLARKRGGVCLSKKYENARTKLRWKCSVGHRFEATPDTVKNRDSWCQKCANKRSAEAKKLGIEKMRQIAKERGGKFLSKKYTDARKRHLWECAEGHQWEATPDSIKNQETWCPYCVRKAKLSVEDMHKTAEERGGEFLSSKYIDARTKYPWKCAEGHKFKKTADSVRGGSWCPTCSSGLGERICREFFEQIFDKKFPKSYPRWLVTEKGNRMELDGYCQSLGLAFEHHGEQHYSARTGFIRTKKALQERQQTDELKKELCRQQGIVLIEIPEIPKRIPINQVKSVIKEECTRHGVSLPGDFDAREINLKGAYATSGSREALKKLQEIASSRGGKCLSDTYVDAHTPLLFQCEKEHEWPASPNSIKNNKWCPECGGTKKLTIEDMHELAKRQGGKFLSKEYKNARSKHKWACAEGHEFKKTPYKVKQDQWCRECQTQRKERAAQKIRLQKLEEMRGLAKERGGKCLSKDYVNNHARILWECVQLHRWWAPPSSIKRGHWCQKCRNTEIAEARKLCIEEMHGLAEDRGGKCLSEVYVNGHTPLNWECAEGHKWAASPMNVKRGSWCPKCANLKRKSRWAKY